MTHTDDVDEPAIDDPFAELAAAIGSHDPDRVAAIFTKDYLCEIPLHPARSFQGRQQVRTNWAAIFASTPDLTARVVRSVTGVEERWSEWEMRGTAPDGTPVLMVGAVIARTDVRGRIAFTRFYLDRVD